MSHADRGRLCARRLRGIAAQLVGVALVLYADRTVPTGVSSQDTASARPELYGAGLFSSSAWDFCHAETPGGARRLFCRADDGFTRFEIVETVRSAAGRWAAPARAAFAPQWSNADPHLSADGATVFFVSNRPLAGAGPERPTHDLWLARRDGLGGWLAAERLPAPINLPDVDVWGPSVAQNGTLYFGAERPGGKGGSDLWMSRFENGSGSYQTPVNLGDAINTNGHELDAAVARDERFLIFAGLNRHDGVGSYDLYASRNLGGRWEPARPLATLNTAGYEFTPSLSVDGRWLYFSSTRRHTGPIGERFDHPRDDRAIAGIGDGKTGDTYRIAVSALGLTAHAFR